MYKWILEAHKNGVTYEYGYWEQIVEPKPYSGLTVQPLLLGHNTASGGISLFFFEQTESKNKLFKSNKYLQSIVFYY